MGDQAFASLNRDIKSTPILVAPYWKKPFRGHIDASSTTVGGTTTQLNESGKDRLISLLPKK